MLFELLNAEKVKPFKGIPGPEPVFPLGNALDFTTAQTYERFLNYSETYGDVTLFWLFSTPNILITGPELLEKMLVTDTEDFYKDSPREALEPIIRNDMFIRNGADDWGWKRREHPFTQSKRDEQFTQLLPQLGVIIREYFAKLSQAKQDIDLWQSLMELYFNVWVQGILGISPLQEVFSDYKLIMDGVTQRLISPVKINPILDSTLQRWHNYFAKIVRERSGNNSNKIDILSQQICRPSNLPTQELETQISTTFIAGVHPTATTLFSVFYLLFHHLEVQNKLRSELEEFVRQHPDNFTLQELNELPYLDQVINETLRLYSTVPFSQRAVAPNRFVKLGNYEIPGNTTMWFSSWAVHLNSKYWPEPLKFNPERFSKTPPPYHFFPFGIGLRECVGKPWATMALKLALVTILPEFKVDIDPNYVYKTKLGPALFIPVGRLNARVTRIRNS